MTALPAVADATGATRNEGQFKAYMTSEHDYLAGLFGTDGVPATALATLGALGATYVAKTGAYTVVAGDRGKVFSCSGTWTLGLTAVATLGAGYSCIIANTGSGTITIDPASAELVDGAATFALGRGRMVLIVCTGSAWITLALAGYVTTSSTDTTAGRLVKTGDFGLGTAINGASVDVDTLTVGDTYGCYGGLHASASTGDNPFPTSSAAFTLRVEKHSIGTASDYVVQTAAVIGAANSIRRRSKTSAWTAWVELFHQGSVLGTVSQTAGVPTGRVIERGSNANGEYVRFADGTQICTVTAAAVDTTTAAGAVYMHTNLLTWTFPAAFAAAPVVAGGGGNSANSCADHYCGLFSHNYLLGFRKLLRLLYSLSSICQGF